jgi:hypothetical protein
MEKLLLVVVVEEQEEKEELIVRRWYFFWFFYPSLLLLPCNEAEAGSRLDLCLVHWLFLPRSARPQHSIGHAAILHVSCPSMLPLALWW